ncbi:rCG62248 [Rattus norvegicus]|uniref:RCG62248 n=1 Tax=Rattus norvegicus TaxID=10116 RepID=A6HBP8_RAT|nr:rCG62248 [Rattus norvegicus]
MWVALHLEHRCSEGAICKFIWSNKEPRRATTIFNNKRTSGGITIPDLNLNYRSIMIKIKLHGIGTETGR